MKTALVVVCLLVGACSPISRYAFKRCPTMTALLGDVAVTGIGLAIGVLAYNADRYARAAAYTGGGMTIALAANLSECRR